VTSSVHAILSISVKIRHPNYCIKCCKKKANGRDTYKYNMQRYGPLHSLLVGEKIIRELMYSCQKHTNTH